MRTSEYLKKRNKPRFLRKNANFMTDHIVAQLLTCRGSFDSHPSI
jgi:hypothetical protein